MFPRSAALLSLAALGVGIAPGAAAAQNRVGLNGAACGYPTIAAALAAAPANADVYLQENHRFVEGGFTISSNVQLRTGTSGCLAPGGAVTKARIDGNGGALAAITIASGATVLFEDLVVTGHLGAEGGNLHVDGDLVLEDVLITVGAATHGGGVFVDSGGSLTITGDSSQVALNNAASGGGIYVEENGTLLLEDNALVWLNDATHGGGGIYALGEVEMDDTAQVVANAAENGGGIYLADEGAGGSLFAECDCVISSNDASGYGGGIYALPGTEIHMILVDLERNEAGFSGGAIDSGADLEMYDVHVEANSAGGYGGGLRSYGPAAIDASFFRNNDAGSSGGGLFLTGETAVHVGTTEVSGNSAAVSGGGMGVNEQVVVELEGVWFDANLADVDGGGLHLVGGASVDATGCFFHDNEAVGSGGGILVDGDDTGSPTLVLDGPQDEEGCIRSPLIQLFPNQYCSELRRNTASRGGGLHMRAGTATIDRTAFLANAATSRSLAIGLEDADGPTLTLRNSLVALHDGAGKDIIEVEDLTTLNALNDTVTDNVGTPVRYHASASGQFVRGIVWDADNFVVDGTNSINAACTSFNGVTGTTTGANRVFFTDPVFITTARGDYRLDPILSPEIDKCAVGTNHDLDSDPRPVGALPNQFDRGAFEVQ